MGSSPIDQKTYYGTKELHAIQNVQKKTEAVKSAVQANRLQVERNHPNLGDEVLTCVPAGRKPSRILGVAVHDKQLVYLVQWQEESKITEIADTTIDGQEDYGNGMTNTNTNVILASAFKEAYPQAAINLYESKTVKIETPSLTKKEEVEEAEKLLTLIKQKKLVKMTEQFKEGLVEDGELAEELKDDDAAIAILRERRLKDKFDPLTSSSESDDDDGRDCALESSEEDDQV